MAEQELEVAIRAGGGRLDSTLARQLPDYTRSQLQALIRAGSVYVNGVMAEKPSMLVSDGDRVRLPAQSGQPTAPQPQAITLDVIYEDQQLLVINKPAGMVVHPGPGHTAGTLVNAVLARIPDLDAGEGQRPGIVHRLDKDTSGLILVAKTDEALAELQLQFKRRLVSKHYLGLVDGAPPTPEGEVQAAIGRHPRQRQRLAVLPDDLGRPAVTRYRTRGQFAKHALLELEPLTGRTHQIRIHMQALKCPIVGDTVYGRRHPSLPVERQMLHAWRLAFRLPTLDAEREFEAPIPADFEAALEVAEAL